MDVEIMKASPTVGNFIFISFLRGHNLQEEDRTSYLFYKKN